MAVPYYGDYPEDHTEIRIPFNTFDSNDPSASVTVTDLADADIMVHADGSLTQIATDGASVIINFDGITGNHMVLIDSSVHADYTTATEYAVRLEGITVDGATINAWIGTFSIERAGGIIALLRTLTTNLATVDTEVGVIDGIVDNIIVDTAEIGAAGAGLTAIPATVDWLDGGRLDLILDTILVDTAVIGAAGAGLTAIPATVDWLDGGRLDLILDAILVDTAVIGAAGAGLTAIPATVDWLDGGRLDLILDAILVDTAAGATAAALATVDTVVDAIQVVTDQFIFTVANIVDANIEAISGDTAAAAALEALMDGVVTFAVNDASATTTAFAADGFTAPEVDDIFAGRLMTLLTGANQYEQTNITGYDDTGGTQGEQEFTVTALTAAPANNVLGIVH